MEIWKDIEGYEGRYLISNKGRVKSLYDRCKAMAKDSIMATKLCKGYPAVNMYNDKLIKKTLLIHRMVAKAFIPNTDNKPLVNHIDGNKRNPEVSNLEWSTYSENGIHAYKVLGKSCNFTGRTGGDSYSAKKVDQFSLDGVFIKSWDSGADIQRYYGFKSSSVSRCCSGELKKSKGFIWRWPIDYSPLQASVS